MVHVYFSLYAARIDGKDSARARGLRVILLSACDYAFHLKEEVAKVYFEYESMNDFRFSDFVYF